eukprot:evm.model.scf_1888.2 EVM.evm.TU.scf_1888.2   scf_1888:26055-28544(+)
MPEFPEECLRHLGRDPRGMVKFADVILAAEGLEFPAHSGVLMMHSGYFKNMLLDLAASGEEAARYVPSKGRRHRIPLGEGVRGGDVKNMLWWMYDRGAVIEKMENIAPLARMADMYEIRGLLLYCEEDLVQKASYMHFQGVRIHSFFVNKPPEDVVSKWGSPDATDVWDAAAWLDFADRRNLKKLMAACVPIVVNGLAKGIDDEDATNAEGDSCVVDTLIRKHSFSARSAFSIALAFGSWVREHKKHLVPGKEAKLSMSNSHRGIELDLIKYLE